MARWNPRALSVVLLLLLHIVPNPVTCAFYDDEKSLRDVVLSGYEYKIRPEETVTCDIRLSLLNINILDVPGQSLSVSGWLTVKWNDSRLTWNPATYGNIPDFYDTELILWRPELIVDNSISNIGVIEDDKLLIRVTSDGHMTWEPPGIFETHCDVDVTFYPFDTQICEIEVTSWAYTFNEVDLNAQDSHIYLHDFQPSGEWEVLDTDSERHLLVDGSDLHSQLTFQIKLRRLPSYYVMTILIPVIVTSVLCVLVFLLPADSGEKVGYALTILLTYVVMLTLVAGYMPPTSKTTSVLSIYLTIILFVGVISTLVTVVGLYFHHHSNARPMPPVLHSIFLNYLIPLVRWQRDEEDGDPSDEGQPQKVYVTKLDVNRSDSASGSRNKIHPNENGKDNGGGEGKQDNMVLSWQDLAVILDKFFLRLMGIFVTVLTVVVLITLLIGGYS